MAGKMRDDEALKMEEGSLFLKVLGGKDPTLKILDFLIDNIGFDYSKTEIASGAGISRTTLFSVWDGLERNELVAFTRNVGRAKMYRLNMRNEVAKKLIELDRAISSRHASRLERLEAAENPSVNAGEFEEAEDVENVEDLPEKGGGVPICLL
jgi:predicted AAA+ superfamily ATPase